MFGEAAVQVSRLAQDESEVIVGLGEVGLEADRLPQLGDCRGEVPEVAHRGADLEVDPGGVVTQAVRRASSARAAA